MAIWAKPHPLGPEISVDWSPTTDPDATPVWASLTSRVREYHARLYRQTELDEFQTGEFALVLDNRDRELEPGYTGSSHSPNVLPRKRIRVQARHNAVTNDRVGGFIRVLPVSWPGQLDAIVAVSCADYGMALNRAQVTLNGYPEELAHTRIGRVLDAVGVPAGDRDLDTSDHMCAEVAALDATSSNQQTVGALEHCRQAALSDGGYLFVARDGTITFHNRAHRRDVLGTPAGTLGDLPGEIPYQPSLVGQMDDSRLWNRAAVLTADATREEASNATSEGAYWPSRRDDFQSLLARPGEAAALASLFVWRYKDARLRFPAVEVLLESSHMATAHIAALLAADVGTRFTVKRRPPGGGAAIDQDVHVDGIQEDVVRGQPWQLSLDVSPADVDTDFWVLGTSTLQTGASPAVVGY